MGIFYATVGACAELHDTNTWLVTFASEDDEDSIEFQRSMSFDEQDRELGMATYCVVLSTGETHYGGIERWSVTGKKISMRFTDEAADTLGVEQDLEIEIEFDEPNVEELARSLVRILGEPTRP